jgi:hypothetical protein
MRAYRALFFATSVFLASVGCQQMDSLQNAATLQRIGFQTLGNGFYFKSGIFLVKLDQAGRVSSIITPLDLHGFEYLESDGPYKAIAVAPKSQRQEQELRLFDENGGCFQLPVSGDGQGPCDDPPPSALFTADESASRTPLKARLAKIARKVALQRVHNCRSRRGPSGLLCRLRSGPADLYGQFASRAALSQNQDPGLPPAQRRVG